MDEILDHARFTTTDDLRALKVRYLHGRAYAEAEKKMRETFSAPTGEMVANPFEIHGRLSRTREGREPKQDVPALRVDEP